jgi:predicted NACHT family NTPase
LNVSSWGEKRQQPLSEWVVESLEAKYSVPQEVGCVWVTHQHIILLDGLDEVAETRRAACLEMIQRYHKEQDAVPLVLCSREIAYQELKQRIAICLSIWLRSICLRPAKNNV